MIVIRIHNKYSVGRSSLPITLIANKKNTMRILRRKSQTEKNLRNIVIDYKAQRKTN